MIRSALIALMLTSMPTLAQQVPDQSAAKRLLFGTRGATVQIVAQPFLSQADIATLGQMPKVAQLDYYGAMAAAPSEGLQSEATRGAFNYHTIEAARAAAVEGCNAARAGGPACVIIAEILPRQYQTGRALTLSQAATKAVDGRDFGRAGREAALAISPTTGAWGLGNGRAAAVAACAAKGARDCEVAVAQ
ncbi:hypothetical protein [Jannaschia pohangensis]|uniref:5-aminolevulic acid synthase n=1 Tax=Jannaschia pohangensis TaxID=390807 RepID=A0A1I3SSR5_9RHOB|nr:hypothetical protein [Jannaschia pohangensis]SFJ61433.1 hypothetical protein SAMN04488095_3258 [Jannaschia pohangensis]